MAEVHQVQPSSEGESLVDPQQEHLLTHDPVFEQDADQRSPPQEDQGGQGCQLDHQGRHIRCLD
jgi:hypothetical protein